ncbi:hypothetical protein NEUTE2DRAFT_70706, partial [Neurospora tetrasperma FGSC 2509]
LYILDKCVKNILEIVYNSKCYFDINRIIKDLVSYLFIKITNKVMEYIKYYLECLENIILRKKLFSKLNPINILPIPGHTITIDFVIILPIYLESKIFKILEGGFNILITYSNKYNKCTLYILG